MLGGVRSGKSAYAEGLAKRSDGSVLYVATATAGDDEMRRRIEEHRRRRPESWRTAEIPLGVGAALRASLPGIDVVLLDCLSVLISNVLLHNEAADEDQGVALYARAEAAVQREIDRLLECYNDSSATFVVVSNEVGLGVVPPYPLGRVYRDLLGMANQNIARCADEVYLLVAGVAVELKKPTT